MDKVLSAHAVTWQADPKAISLDQSWSEPLRNQARPSCGSPVAQRGDNDIARLDAVSLETIEVIH